MTKTVLSRRFLIFILAGYLAALPGRAKADSECTANISFKVGPHQKPQESAEGTPPAAAPREVFFESLTVRGASEEMARAELKKKADISKEKAMAQCKATFENKASCMATKYSIMESVIKTLDFKTRNELQRAIQSDCERQSGVCLEVSAGEAACKEISAAAPEAKPEGGEEGAKAAEEGKDAKGGAAAKKEEKKKK